MTVLTPQQVFELATQHYREGRLTQAETLYRRLLATYPNDAELWNMLGVVVQQSGAAQEAVNLFQRAISLNPCAVSYYNNLGNAHQDLGQFDEAVAAYRKAIECGPEFAPPYTNLGTALRTHGRLEEAVDAYEIALRLDPGIAEAHANLAEALHQLGELDDAIRLYERVINMPGHSAAIFENYLSALQYSSGTDLPKLAAAHQLYDERYARSLRANWQPHLNSRNAERQLRIGFVSPHFHFHPVGYFLIQLLENLSSADFNVFCYSDGKITDSMTSRLKAKCVEWNEVRQMSDENLALKIRRDEVDILFDLAGHTPGNRLLVFARKPAPIQMTWLDYVGTTGLSAIDYILADPRQIPEGTEKYYSEKVLRLPDDYVCFDPPADAPLVSDLPAERNGFVTFGSFNILPKTSASIVDVWCRILQRVPDSRLILKNFAFRTGRAMTRLQRQFEAHSITPDRIDFRDRSPHSELLATYNEIDIALDTFPYNGGLTTCEALWMGVPVVTCPGDIFASRHGIAHLTAAGVSETIAADLTQYVEKAVTMATDLSRLAALRTELRLRVKASRLCDGKRFSTEFADLMRDTWRKWCAIV